jgi:N-acetylmuramoyl-L-alanine amidase
MFKLFLDPGHGGTDSGAVGSGLLEKDLTLDIALRIRDLLINNYSDVWIVNTKLDNFIKVFKFIINRTYITKCSVNSYVIKPVDIVM